VVAVAVEVVGASVIVVILLVIVPASELGFEKGIEPFGQCPVFLSD
jgi:hypothetical protein